MGYLDSNMNYRDILKFYKGKKVLITGNTGFKGSWLTYILQKANAKIAGYSLKPPTVPSLFDIARIVENVDINQTYGDIRDIDSMKRTFEAFKPEIVFHMAAQPIVRYSYSNPVDTYSVNVMGTVNVCECVRQNDSVCSFVNITTDKVYKNNEWVYGYRETDILDGHDPYSNSKSCSELITHSYKDSFLGDNRVRISTARAGNVIGGGDFSVDRIIPDCVRAVSASNGVIHVRNPYAIRPYEHVLEPLFAYLMIAKAQYEDEEYAGCYNIGPDGSDCVTTGDLAELFCSKWNEGAPVVSASWQNKSDNNAPHESNFIRLVCSKLKSVFGWKPRWHIEKAVEEVVSFTKVWLNSGDIKAEMDREISEFIWEPKQAKKKGSLRK